MYFLQGQNAHLQLVRGWGWGNLNHDVECTLEKNEVDYNNSNTRSKWTNEALEEAMDIVEGGIISLKKANRHWNIPLHCLIMCMAK